MSPIVKLIAKVWGVLRPPKYWYAVRDKQTRAWLVDTCAGGTFDVEFGRAVWYDEPDEAYLAITLLACDSDRQMHPTDFQLVRLHVQPNSNHYSMKEIPW